MARRYDPAQRRWDELQRRRSVEIGKREQRVKAALCKLQGREYTEIWIDDLGNGTWLQASQIEETAPASRAADTPEDRYKGRDDFGVF